MPATPAKRRASAGKTSTSNDNHMTDEEITKDRQRVASYEKADAVMRAAGWVCWAWAAVWFFCFAQVVPDVTEPMHASTSHPIVTLLACGLLCTNQSRSSPKGKWSAWRRLWQLGWCPVFAMAGVACLLLSFNRENPFSQNAVWIWTAVCFVISAALLLSTPSGSATPTKNADAPFSRLVFFISGSYGAFVSASVAMAGGVEGNFRNIAIISQVLPILMWSLGTGLCQTEGELLAASPAALLLGICVSGHGFVVGNSVIGVAGSLFCAVHASLYLPLPIHDPTSNIFHTQLVKTCRAWVRFMSQPVSGFGDSAED